MGPFPSPFPKSTLFVFWRMQINGNFLLVLLLPTLSEKSILAHFQIGCPASTNPSSSRQALVIKLQSPSSSHQAPVAKLQLVAKLHSSSSAATKLQSPSTNLSSSRQAPGNTTRIQVSEPFSFIRRTEIQVVFTMIIKKLGIRDKM